MTIVGVRNRPVVAPFAFLLNRRLFIRTIPCMYGFRLRRRLRGRARSPGTARWRIGWGRLVLLLTLYLADRSVAADMLAYEAELTGIDANALRRKLEAAAVTIRQRRVGVRDAETLAWRAGRDAETLRELLLAEGYRRAAVSARVETTDSRRKPLRMILQATPGPLYTLSKVNVAFGDVIDDPLAARIEAAARALEGLPGQAERILRSEAALRDLLRQAGHADARIGRRSVRVFHDTHEMEVDYRLYAGPHGLFGKTRIEGLERVVPKAVERKIPWREGEPFNLAELELARQRLLETDLFLSVRVFDDQQTRAETIQQLDFGPHPEPLEVPVRVLLRERRHRSVGLGLHYFSDDGPAARVFWEHRNVRRHGERLRLESRYSGFLSDWRAKLDIPDFRQLDQTLSYRIQWEDERTDVFESRRWDFETRVERRLSPRWTAGLGLGYLLANVREPREPRTQYDLLYVPASLTFDNRDNPLHPVRGLRAIARVVAFFDVRAPEEAAQFYKNQLQVETHHSLYQRDRLTMAWRGTAGSIMGAGLTRRVPIDQRFYSGGGGSVRGYAYQGLGPVRDERPTGGRSLAETSVELRTRIGESWGAAWFLDGGMAFPEMIPESLQPLLWSTGIGLRFFTGVGPLRIDLAFPLQRRTDKDSAFSIYIGLGQAF